MFGIPMVFMGSSGPSQAQFESQANTGLNVKLEYVDSTTIKLSSNSGSTISVITPDLKTIDVSTSGLTATVSGSTSTLYYVYLASTGLSFSTSATDASYTSMKTLGGTKILLGYMGCSASNAIAGTHNVFSYWNEPARSWTQSTTSLDSTALALNGFVLPTGKTTSSSWSGSVTGTSYYQMNCEVDSYFSGSISATSTSLGTTDNSQFMMFGGFYYWSGTWYRSQTLSLNNTTISSGVSNINVFLSATASSSFSNVGALPCGVNTLSYGWTSISGTITLTRPGS